MRIASLICGGLLVACSAVAPVYGDFVVFTIPTTKVKLILQGRAIESRSQPLINFTHASTRQTFDLPKLGDTTVVAIPTMNQIANKRIIKAKGDEPALREVATWCLDHSLLTEFHRAVDQLAGLNASDPFVVEVNRIKDELAKPVSISPEDENQALNSFGSANSRTLKGNHILMVATSDKPDKADVKRKKPEQRLEQLEQFLEIFLMKCADRGLPARVPAGPLRVAVVAEIPKDIKSAEPNVQDTGVFWSTTRDVLLIDERARIPHLDSVRKLQSEVQKVAAIPRSKRQPANTPGAIPGAGAAPGGTGGSNPLDQLAQMSTSQLSKLSATMAALMTIGVEGAEWESTSREFSRMLLNHCGVVNSQTPQWVRDGLALYFESPIEFGGLKIGDVGQVRQAWYQASLRDPIRYTARDVITGRCYAEVESANVAMRASTQSWALMHFLLNEHSEGLAQYLSAFQSMPPDVVLSEDVLVKIFDQSMNVDAQGLDEDWHRYMESLKPDYQAVQDLDEARGSSDS